MSARGISRLQFLRGDFTGRAAPQRPPWALPEARFTELCDGCGDCIGACPEGILVSGRGGFPQVDFGRGGCTFCGECVQACGTGALADGSGRAWSLKAYIDETCVTNRGVECRSCGDHCDPLAIRFRPRAGSVARPMLDQAQCTGCGSCQSVCPAGSIQMHRG